MTKIQKATMSFKTPKRSNIKQPVVAPDFPTHFSGQINLWGGREKVFPVYFLATHFIRIMENKPGNFHSRFIGVIESTGKSNKSAFDFGDCSIIRSNQNKILQ